MHFYVILLIPYMNSNDSQTISMDYRSLVHHYENGVWMYKAEVIRAMKEDFCFTQEESMEIHGDAIRMKWFQMLGWNVKRK